MSGALRTALAFYRLNLRLTRHSWSLTLFLGFLLPLLTVWALGQKMDAQARTRLLIGQAVYATMLVNLRKTAIQFTADRALGTRDLLATTTLGRSGYLLGTALDVLTTSLLPIAVLLVGWAAYDIAPPSGLHWLLPFALLALGCYAFGVLFGSLTNSLASAGLAVNLGIFGALALCPLIYPVERVPEALRPVVERLPPSLGSEALDAWWNGTRYAWEEMGLLAAWTLLAMLVGLRVFPWTRGA